MRHTAHNQMDFPSGHYGFGDFKIQDLVYVPCASGLSRHYTEPSLLIKWEYKPLVQECSDGVPISFNHDEMAGIIQRFKPKALSTPGPNSVSVNEP